MTETGLVQVDGVKFVAAIAEWLYEFAATGLRRPRWAHEVSFTRCFTTWFLHMKWSHNGRRPCSSSS